MLVLREKTKDEIEKEEEEYRAYLQREVGGDLADIITVDAELDGTAPQPEEDERPKKKSKKEKKEKATGKKTKQDDDQGFLMK